MSLFPAYAADTKNDTADSDLETTEPCSTKEWLRNESFNVQNVEELIKLQCGTKSSSTSDTDIVAEAEEATTEKTSRKRKKTKHKKVCKTEKEISFDEHVDFYVDKQPVKMYRSISTLHKPACPRYSRRFYRCLGWQHKPASRNLCKRYFKQLTASSKHEVAENMKSALSEEEYNSRLCGLNRRIMESSENLQYWLNLIELQERNPYKWSRLLLAEKKLELLERALTHHTRNEHLYRLYIDIVNATYPSFEASKMLDKLLMKDPYNYTLWTAQIMSTQGTMARCIVPDVLQIYARCMQKMHHNAQKRNENSEKALQSDVVMLKLFYNCALFLRQAGLMEMFFALIKLALELNVSTVLFGDFAPAAEDQRTLIEYEELVLQSGLPLNEIWLRVEKLRQCFNFLPCPVNAPSSDPQRIVFNEDVCHYIYPLKQRDSVFHMLLLIVRLLKVPFVQTDSLAELFNARVEHIGDSDAIEDVLAICNRNSFLMPALQHEQFALSLYELAKEMTVTPTFLNNSVAHKIYTDFVLQFLMNCAASYEVIDERRRLIFLLLWCRFQRLLIILLRISGKTFEEEAKLARQQFKALLKQPPNRNLMPLYIEFAIYEYERAPQQHATWQNLFESIIINHQESDAPANLAQLYLYYAEILVAQGAHSTALELLCCYALKLDVRKKSQIGAATYLLAFQRLSEQLEMLLAIEQNVTLMVTEQYLLPDKTICLIRIVCLMQYLLGHKKQSLEQLDKWLKIFNKCENSARQRFIYEQLHEIYISMAQLPAADYQFNTASLAQRIFAALDKFPRNLFLLQQCSMLAVCMPWYKIRAAVLRNTTTVATVTILIAIIRQRYFQMINNNQYNQLPWLASVIGCAHKNDRQHAEIIMRNRVLDMFKKLVESAEQPHLQQNYNTLHRNGLFWRFYLRCLSDQCTDFESSRNCLLMALDECPWNKSLYLDGATHVPQELPKLQDLIIEKQLRICALPEELEILRE